MLLLCMWQAVEPPHWEERWVKFNTTVLYTLHQRHDTPVCGDGTIQLIFFKVAQLHASHNVNEWRMFYVSLYYVYTALWSGLDHVVPQWGLNQQWWCERELAVR